MTERHRIVRKHAPVDANNVRKNVENNESIGMEETHEDIDIITVEEEVTQTSVPEESSGSRKESLKKMMEEIQDDEPILTKKKNIIKLAITCLVGVLIIVFGIVVSVKVSKMLSAKDQPAVSSTQTTIPQVLTSTGDGQSINPVTIYWPNDVVAGNLEIKEDKKTGDPTFFLTGTKKGLGSVVRQYDKSGKLIGFWVIVDEGAPQTTGTTTPQSNTTNQTTNKGQ